MKELLPDMEQILIQLACLPIGMRFTPRPFAKLRFPPSAPSSDFSHLYSLAAFHRVVTLEFNAAIPHRNFIASGHKDDRIQKI